MNENENLNVSNGLQNKILIESIKEGDIVNEKESNLKYIDSFPVFNLNINKLKKDVLIEEDKKIDEVEEHKKQNESHEMLFNEIKNDDSDLKKKEKIKFSKINVMNILNKKFVNKRSSSVINSNTMSGSLILSHLSNKNKNNDLANTQRENKNVFEKKEEEN